MPVIPVAPATAAVQPMQFLTPYYLLTQISPIVQYGVGELSLTNPTHTITETALIAYLMGLGFDYRTALAIVESWECNQALLRDGLLCEAPANE
ncbi:hypothetical protein [Acetonema longum]|nr:hypothetical protein [Acetonema longum]